MIAVPAIDLREGACVQLVGGSYADERVRIADPLEALARWYGCGFRRLHVVDLDAALGKGSNASIIGALLAKRPDVRFSVGGGVRDVDTVERLLVAGAADVVVGTRAIEDGAWLAELCAHFPGKVIVAADVRGEEVVTRGWTAGSGRKITDVLTALAPLALSGVLVTAVHKEGQLQGPDTALLQKVAGATRHRVIASGGVTRFEDLHALKSAGAESAVIGMALYTGALDAQRVAQEFA